jgi:23S rRNA (guanosine2251-2'-O)-methyltransferase
VTALPGAENHHQGVIAQMSQVAPLQLSDFLSQLEKKRAGDQSAANPLVVVVDQIEDPHNLGAIIRVAEASGAAAILLPERRSAGVTWAVAKSSAGASAVLPVVSIPNVVRALEKLKEAGFWIAGLSHDAKQTYFEADLKRPLAVVIGNEGYGLTRLVSENCDLHLRIPMLGQTESLNASVAAGIVLYDFVRQNCK